jgi:hypothetical protein
MIMTCGIFSTVRRPASAKKLPSHSYAGASIQEHQVRLNFTRFCQPLLSITGADDFDPHALENQANRVINSGISSIHKTSFSEIEG